jgi:hypothetical protein
MIEALKNIHDLQPLSLGIPAGPAPAGSNEKEYVCQALMLLERPGFRGMHSLFCTGMSGP